MYADFRMLRAEDAIQNSYNVSAEKYRIPEEGGGLHWHDYFTLDLILDGRGIHYINGQQEELLPGMVQLIYPTDIHTIAPEEDMRLISIRFTEHALSEQLFNLIYGKEIRKLYPKAAVFNRIHACAEAMIEELDAPENPFCKELVSLHFQEIILLVAREGGAQEKREKSAAEKILLYLNEHFRENLSLEQAAAYTNYSAPYFSAFFKKEVGKTYSQYLMERKIEYACTLLKNTDYSVTEVCFASGFGSISHFNACFKSKTGMSPMRYRHQYSATTSI